MGTKSAIAAVFSAVWCLFVTEGVSPNAPLSVFAALYLAGAWLSYLKKDGLAIFRLRRPVATEANQIDGPIIEEPDEPTDDDEKDDAAMDFKLGVGSSIATAVLLVAVSFLFPS